MYGSRRKIWSHTKPPSFQQNLATHCYHVTSKRTAINTIHKKRKRTKIISHHLSHYSKNWQVSTKHTNPHQTLRPTLQLIECPCFSLGTTSLARQLNTNTNKVIFFFFFFYIHTSYFQDQDLKSAKARALTARLQKNTAGNSTANTHQSLQTQNPKIHATLPQKNDV